ncbi:uncharacterized protein LOC144704710 [Wolffia australiana]
MSWRSEAAAAAAAAAAELDMLKAVAHAWHAHADNAGAADEFDVAAAVAARRGAATRRRPSRFMVEAAAAAAAAEKYNRQWDFGQSLWDSYEIVALTRRLDTALAAEDRTALDGGAVRRRLKRESNRSLRSLLRRSSDDSDDASVR